MKITLVGSTRFEHAFKEANKRLTLAGHLVYSVACLSRIEGVTVTDEMVEMYDLTHLAKIAASDAVLVLDVNGYQGNATKREVAWAQMTGKILSYLSTGAQQIEPAVDLSDLCLEPAPTSAPTLNQPFRLASSSGAVDVVVGTRFAADGCVWEIISRPTADGIYSPGNLGGTNSVRCKLISGVPDGRFTPWMENGEVDWCGDSIAAKIVCPDYAFARIDEQKARAESAEAQVKTLTAERDQAREVVEAALVWGAAETPEQEAATETALANATRAYRDALLTAAASDRRGGCWMCHGTGLASPAVSGETQGAKIDEERQREARLTKYKCPVCAGSGNAPSRGRQ